MITSYTNLLRYPLTKDVIALVLLIVATVSAKLIWNHLKGR